MSFLTKLLFSVILLENKFKVDESLEGPATPHEPSYNVVYEGLDEKGRPELLVKTRSYKDVPNCGTFPGYQVHSKLEPEGNTNQSNGC